MFGALNRFISRLDSEPFDQKGGLEGTSGFQILKNSNKELPIEPWFDYIIGINGRTLDNPDANLFAQEIRNSAGSSVSLGIFSAKGQRIREIYVPIPSDSPTLGLSLQWTSLSAAEDVWHILDVIANSPADVAGLLPYSDYVIGSPEGLVKGESGLGELVEDFLQRPMRLIVYNHEYNVTRPITITPSRSWGGTGALGCVLGFGALHRIPPPLDEPPEAPGETLFDTSGNGEEMVHNQNRQGDGAGAPGGGAEYLVPANMAFQAPSQTGSPGPDGSRSGTPVNANKPARKQRAHHVTSPGTAMDEYFKEGEEKSKKEDFAPSSSAGTRPPPKSSGPPKGGPPKGGPPKG